jgi:hypothetical protein
LIPSTGCYPSHSSRSLQPNARRGWSRMFDRLTHSNDVLSSSLAMHAHRDSNSQMTFPRPLQPCSRRGCPSCSSQRRGCLTDSHTTGGSWLVRSRPRVTSPLEDQFCTRGALASLRVLASNLFSLCSHCTSHRMHLRVGAPISYPVCTTSALPHPLAHNSTH